MCTRRAIARSQGSRWVFSCSSLYLLSTHLPGFTAMLCSYPCNVICIFNRLYQLFESNFIYIFNRLYQLFEEHIYITYLPALRIECLCIVWCMPACYVRWPRSGEPEHVKINRFIREKEDIEILWKRRKEKERGKRGGKRGNGGQCWDVELYVRTPLLHKPIDTVYL